MKTNKKKTAIIKITQYFIGTLIGIFLLNCKATFNGDVNFGDTSSGTTSSSTIGGTITDLAFGDTITLINNGSETITITGDGSASDQFTFTETVASGDTYFVAVLTQPAGKTCSVGGGFGTVGETDVSTIEVVCVGGAATTYWVGGTVAGLSGSGLIITNNLIDNKVLVGNGAFSFSGLLNDLAPYSVAVTTQPTNPSQTCTVAGGSGAIAAANVSTVAVTCVTNQYTMSGTVNGLTGVESVTLQNNGGDNLVVPGLGGGSDPFIFATALNDASAYNVTVLTAPAGKTCTVGGLGTGTLAGANVSGINVTCAATPTYTVGGTLIGVNGSVTLQNNAGDNLVLAADGAFSFATPALDATGYNATVLTQPTAPNQSCIITNPSGTVSGSNVTSITVVCTTNKYTLGGTVSGLGGAESVTVVNNFGENLVVNANGAFTFGTSRNDGSFYNVTISSSPAGKICLVGAGSGTIAGANVSGITVTCSVSANYTVSATVNGINGTVVLQNNSGDDISITANGTYVFGTPLATGSTYAVTVLTQPSNPIQACTITNGAGTIGAANITNINVICTTATFTVGGTVTGLAVSEQVILQNNAADNIAVIGDGSSSDAFASAPVNDQGAYAITVLTSPAGKTCTVGSGSGTVAGSNVTTVTVTCNAIATYSIGGTVTGYDITSSSLVLVNTDTSESLSLSVNGGFTFGTTQVGGTNYTATVSQQPGAPNQSCTVTNGVGVVGAANITNISVNCTTSQYSIGGTATGLKNTEVVVLQNNAGDNLNITGGGTTIDPFTFATSLNDGVGYNVTVLSSPAGKTCSVGGGAGTLAGVNITDIAVSCSAIPQYSVGGTVTGYTGLGLILQNNGGDDLAIAADGNGSFPTTLLDTAAYNVTVLQQPANPNQTCVIVNGNGSIAGADVTNVAINCTTTQYTVTANVTGSAGGSSITILNNGADAQTRTGNGPLIFTAQDDLTTYNITVQTAPAGEICTVGAGTGTVDGGDITNVTITCSGAATYTVGGSVSGLVGTGLVLHNGGEDLVIAADGAYSFATALSGTDPYSVAVKTNPNTPAQTCSVVNAVGVIAAANIVNVNITCTTVTYTISGTVAGLMGSAPGPLENTILLYNGVAKIVDGDTPAFQMPQINDGTSSDFQIVESPYGKDCTFDSNGTNIISPLNIAGADVINQNITCSPLTTASVVVNVTGLTSGTLSVTNSTFTGSQQNDFVADGSFGYTAQPQTSQYTIQIASQPAGHTCGITSSNASGSMPGVNVNVNINCSAGGGGPVCGDQTTDAGEDCDDGGESAACNSDCTFAICGDNILNLQASETCDDGNTIDDGNGCSVACLTTAVCGNSITEIGEACDTAGVNAAGCDYDCTAAVCGDFIINTPDGEECDDGNTVDDGNGCSATCLVNAVCGNSVVEAGEQCDDGNAIDDGNGCSAGCQRNNVCGNSIVENLYEECDPSGPSCSTGCYITGAADIYEADDTDLTAQPITINGGMQYHTLNVNGDLDWVTFTLSPADVPTTLNIVTSDGQGGCALDTTLTVYDGFVFTVTQAFSGPFGICAGVSVYFDTADTYYVKVQGDAANMKGAYALEVREPVAPPPLCPGGVGTTYTAVDTPLAIPDLVIMYSNINVAGGPTNLRKVKVNMDMDHPFASDLEVNLIAPNGQEILLAKELGSSMGFGYWGTIFDSCSSLFIADYDESWTGVYSPQGELSILNGINSNGLWKLKVIDWYNLDTGTLNSWSIELE